MNLYLFILSAALGAPFAAAAWSMPSQLTPIPCNPAVHCLPEALECISASVDRHGNIPHDFVVEKQEPGFCTEVYRPKCTWKNGKCIIKNENAKKKVKPEQHQFRCAQLMVTPESRFKKANVNDYNSACMEGYYTCFDGSCQLDAADCRKACKKAKCDKSPVRYSPDRCDADCRTGTENALPSCPDFKNKTITDHQIIVPSPRPAPLPNITVPDFACCKTGPYEERYPSWTGLFGSYESEACCADLAKADFTDISNDYKITTKPGKYNIYPITGIQSNETVQAVEVEIGFAQPGQDNDCCCNMLCTCAGDPHCSSFDGTQAVSRLEDGQSLNMVTEGDFSLYVTMGVDGIINEITVTLPGYTCEYHLKAKNFFDEKWQRTCDGETEIVPKNELPDILTLNVNSDSQFFCDSDKSAKDCTSMGGTLKIGSTLEVTLFLRKFVPLLTNDDPVFRFDVEIERYLGPRDEENCCPGPDTALPELLDSLKTTYGGFCYTPKAKDVKDFFAKDGIIFPRSLEMEESGRMLGKKKKNKNAGTSNLDNVEVCNKYLQTAIEVKGKTLDRHFEMQQCVNDFIDYGETGVESLMASLKTSKCQPISAEDIRCAPAFKKPLSQCASGITLEAKLAGSNDEWQFVRSFMANKDYKRGKITLEFVNGKEIEFDYNGVPTTLNVTKHKIRFIERMDKPSECNQCRPKEAVTHLSVAILYAELVKVVYPPEPQTVECYKPSVGCKTCEFLNQYPPGLKP